MKRTYTVWIMPGEPDEGGYWVEVQRCAAATLRARLWKKLYAMSKKRLEGHILSLMDERNPCPGRGR